MKRILLLIVVFAATMGLAQAQKVRPSEYAAYVNLVSESKGAVTVRSTGWGKNEAQALEDAEVRAMLTLLYVGLPTSAKHGAMVANESEANTKNPSYFEQLITQRAYKKFVMSSAAKGSFSKMKGDKVKSMAVDVTVNTDALRKDLEANEIVRKFGF